MEIYTDTMTASTPSLGMPVVAAFPRGAAVCPQQLETAVTAWSHMGTAVVDAAFAARGIDLDAIRVKGAFPGPTAWRPPIV